MKYKTIHGAFRDVTHRLYKGSLGYHGTNENMILLMSIKRVILSAPIFAKLTNVYKHYGLIHSTDLHPNLTQKFTYAPLVKYDFYCTLCVDLARGSKFHPNRSRCVNHG